MTKAFSYTLTMSLENKVITFDTLMMIDGMPIDGNVIEVADVETREILSDKDLVEYLDEKMPLIRENLPRSYKASIESEYYYGLRGYFDEE